MTIMIMTKITVRMIIYGDVLTLHVKLLDLLPKGAARNLLLSNQPSITQVPHKTPPLQLLLEQTSFEVEAL